MNVVGPRPRQAPALAAALAGVLALVGCGAPPAPELTDPVEIVQAALASTETATSVHAEVTVTGSLNLSIIPGAPGAPVELTGTTASADLDLANGAARATFGVPTLFDLAGELIAVDGKAYVKTTATGPTYTLTDLGASGPTDLTDVRGLLDGVGDLLLDDRITLTKGGDVSCGGPCYAVSTSLAPADVVALLGGEIAVPAGLPIDLDGAAIDIEVRVEKALPRHLGGLTFIVTLPGGDPLTLDVTFSKWDAGVTVVAPPPDQVSGG